MNLRRWLTPGIGIKRWLLVVFIGLLLLAVAFAHFLRQITRDQSLVQLMVEHGVMTAEDARRAPGKNVILQAVGLEGDVRVAIARLALRRGDRFLQIYQDEKNDDGRYGCFPRERRGCDQQQKEGGEEAHEKMCPVCHSERSEESSRTFVPLKTWRKSKWILRCAQNDRKGFFHSKRVILSPSAADENSPSGSYYGEILRFA